MDPAAHEQRLQFALDMLPGDSQFGNGVRSGTVAMDAARLQGSYPDTRAILVLTSEAQPECTFGFRARAWNAAGRTSAEDSFGTPDEVAWIITVHVAPASRVTVSFPNQLAGFHPILEVAGFARSVAIEVRFEGLK